MNLAAIIVPTTIAQTMEDLPSQLMLIQVTIYDDLLLEDISLSRLMRILSVDG
jgi:hypothetical protein